MAHAFKEWALICEALGAGAQTIILRKGGIAEGREGFSFKERSFYLFPTLYHEQASKLRIPAGTPVPAQPSDHITIGLHAATIHTATLNDWESIQKLDPFHIWKPEVIRERFEFDARQEIHLAILRISRLDPPYVFENSPNYGGCRSWIEIPEPPAHQAARPVIDDAAFDAAVARILQLLPSAQSA